jgi:exonuclease SbcD
VHVGAVQLGPDGLDERVRAVQFVGSEPASERGLAVREAGAQGRDGPKAAAVGEGVGGGALVDVGSHAIDLARFLAGAEPARVRADLAAHGAGARSVVVAHEFVAGAQESDSERDLAVGGAACVPAATFAGVDYVALGHLHGPQVLADCVRYSGSPLPYSFGEAGHDKQAWLVELDAGGLADVRAVPLPPARPLRVLTGELPTLLADPAHDAAADCFVSARLTDPVRPVDPMRQLQARFPHCVHLEWTGSAPGADGRSYQELLRGRSDLEVAEQFVDRVRGVAASAAERSLLGRALSVLDREEVAR